jgi:hypothetical protein
MDIISSSEIDGEREYCIIPRSYDGIWLERPRKNLDRSVRITV